MAHRTPLSILLPALAVSWFALAPGAEAQLKLPRRPAERNQPKPRGDVAPYMVCNVCNARTYTARVDGRKDDAGHDLVWCEVCKRDTPHRSNVNTDAGLGDGKPAAGGDLRLPRRPAAPAPATNPEGTPPPAATPPDAPASTSSSSPAGSPAANPATNPAADPNAPSASDGTMPVDPANPNAPAPASDPVVPSTTPAPDTATAGSASGVAVRGSASVASVLADLQRAKSIDDAAATRAIEGLLAAGDAGLEAARGELRSEDAVRLVVAARVLLRGGSDADVERVETRLRAKVPSAASVLVDDAVARDPVRAGPEWLAGLLDHPQGSVRQTAARALGRSAGPGLIPYLERAVTSKRGDTRQHVVELASSIEDPRATEILLARLDDVAPRVAAAAVAAVVRREEAGLDARLLSIAFKDRWVLRRGAYAIVALVDREDVRLENVLDATHVEPLLIALESSDAFVSGTAATALAGIGFRSRDPRHAEWLDRPVMDRLVMTVSGKEFHDDLSSLAPSALRRLRLLSGQTLSADGPRWVDWWVGAREGFHARRAALPIEPNDIAALVVRFQSTVDGAEAFALVGPDAAEQAEAANESGEIVYLNLAQATDLAAVLTREGLTSADKLPGTRGARARGDRTVEIRSRGRAKSFTFGAEAHEPWFDRAADACRGLRERNRWQRFPEAGRHANALALWREQGDWWGADHTDLQRDERMKSLVLASMRTGSPAQRDLCVSELERLATRSGAISAADFAPLVALMHSETGASDRGRRLARIALLAGTADAVGEPRVLPDERASALATVCCLLSGTHATEALDETLSRARREFVRGAANDPLPMLRGAVARALARQPSPEDVVTLVKLLDDKDSFVETTATLALGENKVEAARDELLVRARVGLTPVRTAALEAIGRMGGEYVLEALIAALSDRERAVRIAGAKGLAALGDPAAAQVLIASLGDGADTDVFDAARAGLVSMGEKAWPDLVRTVNQPMGRIRREAALILAEQSHPDAVSPLIAILTASPKDARVAAELAVLTCIDMRGQADPSRSWWDWWDGVRHDDATLWFRAALERAGVAPPPPGALEGGGTVQGRSFLVSQMARPEPWLVERARRELRRLLGRDPGELPAPGPERDAFLRALRDSVSRDASRG